MTNWEKFKREIQDIGMDNIAVSKLTNIPTRCGGVSCGDCVFTGRCSAGEFEKAFIEWFNAEYIPPKDHIEIATLISFLRMEPNQMKQVKSIKIVDGMPVINGGE